MALHLSGEHRMVVLVVGIASSAWGDGTRALAQVFSEPVPEVSESTPAAEAWWFRPATDSQDGTDKKQSGPLLAVRLSPDQEKYDLKQWLPAEREIIARLNSPLLAPLEFRNVPLGDVLKEIGNIHQIPIRLNERALAEVGLSIDDSVSFSGANTLLRSSLRILLDKFDLTYLVRDEVLVITTIEHAESDQSDVRVYPIDDRWAMDTQTLTKIVTETVEPYTWSDNGGPASIVQYPGGLVISQTYVIHEQINDLWRQLAVQAALHEEGQ